MIQRLMMLTSLALLVGALACVPPDRTDYSPDDLVDDGGGTNLPSADDDDDVTPGDDDDASSDDDDIVPDPGCEPLDPSATEFPEQVLNCEGECSPFSWLADEECDEVLNCEALFFDAGDCSPE
jgi:hypothetical protein